MGDVACEDLARTIRMHALKMVHGAKASHIGGCLSMADLLAVLYGRVLRVDPARPGWADRDRLIVSKGHGAAIVYAVLAERGFFPVEQLATYCQDGTDLAGHISPKAPGVEVATGSLGHGLSIGCGMALAAKRGGCSWRVFVVLSDGDCDEGSTWEAALFAPQHELGNLIAIVDYNKMQAFGRTREVLDLDPLADKWRAFRWAVQEIDGHDVPAIINALERVPLESGKPTAIIAHTVKGKGVSFMEDNLLWHYRPPDDALLARALAELGDAP